MTRGHLCKVHKKNYFFLFPPFILGFNEIRKKGKRLIKFKFVINAITVVWSEEPQTRRK